MRHLMFHALIFLFSFPLLSADDGWLEATKTLQGTKLDFDLQANPLEIKTEETEQSADKSNVVVQFLDSQGLYSGGVEFSRNNVYSIRDCMIGARKFTTAPPAYTTENTRVWRVTVDRTSGIRILAYCDGKEVLNQLMSDSICEGNFVNDPASANYWKTRWSRMTTKVEFSSSWDLASKWYRPYKEPMCEAPTIGNGKVSPSNAISPESIYSVTCNDGYTLKGNSDIKCTEQIEKATLSTSPTCEKDAKDEDETKLSFANCLKANAALFVVLTVVLLI